MGECRSFSRYQPLHWLLAGVGTHQGGVWHGVPENSFRSFIAEGCFVVYEASVILALKDCRESWLP